MNTLTHALLPAIAAGIANKSYAPLDQRRGLFSSKEIFLIALLGAAPDLINPHITLAARLTSWSHSMVFFVPMALVLLIAPCIIKKLRWRLVPWLIGAYALHLFCDFIAGGIAWAYPLKADFVGKYYISAIYWIPIDILLAVTSYFLFRAIPNVLARRRALFLKEEKA